MIIGKNTNFQAHKGNSFINNNNNTIPSNNNPLQGMDPMIEQNRAMQHTDVMNPNEMNNKAFAILEDRLNKGLITMEEFNKKCAQLGKHK